MKNSAAIAIISLLCGSAIWADENTDRAAQLESSGDAAGARLALGKAAQATPSDLGTLTAYAAFLERYGDPEARTVYRQLLVQSNKTGDRAHALEASRRLVVLDVLAGDH